MNQSKPIEWQPDFQNANTSESLLWLFQLHYHEYLLPLLNGDSNDHALIERTIVDWIEQNPVESTESHLAAWHAYCISRRLPVWFCLLAKSVVSESVRPKMLQSAFDQAAFLSGNLEWDLRGNHLLENLRALALAAAFYSGIDEASEWSQIVRDVLPDQIKEQVLPWGEHFERCPMYHCQILGNFLETMIVSQSVDPELYRMLANTTERMLQFLESILHADGEIPLFGDSCFGEAPSVACLRDLQQSALKSPMNPTTATGQLVGPYWIHRHQNDTLIFDRGDAGAKELPAHAHCDL